MKFIDLTGQKFGRWTVLERDENNCRNETQYLCKCECGNVRKIKSYALKNGSSKSCGCLSKELAKQRQTKHGKVNSRLYSIWHGMKRRCNATGNKDYKNYGGRGINICQEWLDDFMNFHNWSMANGYDDTLTIDRIDVNGNYEPSNCRWVTRKEQANNRKTTILLNHNGETHSVVEWAKILGIHKQTMYKKLKEGVSLEDIIKSKNML